MTLQSRATRSTRLASCPPAAIRTPHSTLQPQEAAGRPLCPGGHVVGIAEPDRPGRRRPDPRQPEQLVHGPPDELSLEVVERRVDRGTRRELASRQPFHDLLDRERVVAEL